jgi:hypothetical protein
MYRSKTQAVRRKKMTTEQKLERAMSLVSRAGDFFSDDPPEDWFRDYYILTGEHMVATEEGWQLGSNNRQRNPSSRRVRYFRRSGSSRPRKGKQMSEDKNGPDAQAQPPLFKAAEYAEKHQIAQWSNSAAIRKGTPE